MIRMKKQIAFLFFLVTVISGRSQAYAPGDILHRIQKLHTVGSVLYVAAHPDDENTRLISWLANEKNVRTAYISLTRGDGGQNLIGNELGTGLGVIRTRELMAARETDGGIQYFSRARDFGFSKTPEETLEKWDKEIVLYDLVYTIREFRPDVIITRFNPAPMKTHGHHTASAQLALEAFTMAASDRVFPDQLTAEGGLKPWQATRILWNTSTFFFQDKKDFRTDTFLVTDVGGYNPLLGLSYNEMAARSRSMHKSQGFGTPESRGSQPEYFSHLAGSRAAADLFEGIDLSWKRLAGGEAVDAAITAVEKDFSVTEPWKSVPALIQLYKELGEVKDAFWRLKKQGECREIIRLCLGLYTECTVNASLFVPGDSIAGKLELINRSPLSVKLVGTTSRFFNETPVKGSFSQVLDKDKPVTQELFRRVISRDAVYSVPYWLAETPSDGLFTVSKRDMRNKPWNTDWLSVTVNLLVEGQEMTFRVPVFHRRPDPVKAEVISDPVVLPPVTCTQGPAFVDVFPGANRPVVLELTAHTELGDVEILTGVVPGYQVSPATLKIDKWKKGETRRVEFNIGLLEKGATGTLEWKIRINGNEYPLRKLVKISYDHIPPLIYSLPYDCRIQNHDYKLLPATVGYIPGAGDDVPSVLERLRYSVKMLDAAALPDTAKSGLDAVVVGIRAFNTLENAPGLLDWLTAYARSGGTVIVQYNTTAGLKVPSPGPYPLKISRERVTVEESPVKILNENHPVLNFPNVITTADFDGWVQERGLYFPSEWSSRYDVILEMNDPEEAPQEGSLLIAKTGKGYFVYTGLAFFRQLPAGVPGATRLFINMLSLGKSSTAK